MSRVSTPIARRTAGWSVRRRLVDALTQQLVPGAHLQLVRGVEVMSKARVRLLASFHPPKKRPFAHTHVVVRDDAELKAALAKWVKWYLETQVAEEASVDLSRIQISPIDQFRGDVFVDGIPWRKYAVAKVEADTAAQSSLTGAGL